jgi:ribosome biogenesis GTPase A
MSFTKEDVKSLLTQLPELSEQLDRFVDIGLAVVDVIKDEWPKIEPVLESMIDYFIETQAKNTAYKLKCLTEDNNFTREEAMLIILHSEIAWGKMVAEYARMAANNANESTRPKK